MKRALVTGSAGFVGRHFVVELEARGWEVMGCDLLPRDGRGPVDALDRFRTDHHPYDLVVHAAARSPHRAAIDGQPSIHAYNHMLDAAMFDWAVRTGQDRVLYLSSCAVLDGPDDYGWTKLTGERLARNARACGVPVTVVRPFSGYGEDQGADWPFGAFMQRARERHDPFEIWGNGQQVRDWIHVDDVVRGALAVVESGTDESVSLCTGRGVSMLTVAQYACEVAGYQPEFKLRGDAPAGARWRVGDPSALRRYYQPTVSLEEGVQRALAGGTR